MEVESRMRQIDIQLLMHTAAVLQLTHNGTTSQNRSSQVPNGIGQRPDSPASIFTYDTSGVPRSKGEDEFDERSLYRSPENLDSLMHALKNGTHNRVEPEERHNDVLEASLKRIESLNGRIRELMVQANPERNREYSLPPRIPTGTLSAPAVDQQLEFLDQGLRDLSVELDSSRTTPKQLSGEIEGRLDGLNNQLYALLGKSGDKAFPPPPIAPGGSEQQVHYMEDAFENLQQMHFSMSEQLEELRSQADLMAQQMDQLRSQAAEDLQVQADEMDQRMGQLRLRAAEDLQAQADELGRQMDQLRSQAANELQSERDLLNQQIEQLRLQASEHQDNRQASNNQDSQYEATLMGLWSIIQAGEEEARQRKQKRRELLASDPDADEELSEIGRAHV